MKAYIRAPTYCVSVSVSLRAGNLPMRTSIGAYSRHFQAHFKEYGTNAELADLLGLSTNRRVRAFKEGSTLVP